MHRRWSGRRLAAPMVTAALVVAACQAAPGGPPGAGVVAEQAPPTGRAGAGYGLKAIVEGGFTLYAEALGTLSSSEFGNVYGPLVRKDIVVSAQHCTGPAAGPCYTTGPVTWNGAVFVNLYRTRVEHQDNAVFRSDVPDAKTEVLFPFGTPAAALVVDTYGQGSIDFVFTDFTGRTKTLTVPNLDGMSYLIGASSTSGIQSVRAEDVGAVVFNEDIDVNEVGYRNPTARLIASGLIAYVDSVTATTLTTAQVGSLKTKLEGAVTKLEAERVNTARNQIGAFKNEVNAMVNAQQLPALIGQDLTYKADQILAGQIEGPIEVEP